MAAILGILGRAIRRNSRLFGAHFVATPARPGPYIGCVKNRRTAARRRIVRLASAFALTAGLALPASAEPLDRALATQLHQWAQEQAQSASTQAGVRAELSVGQLDPRLRLAPCAKIEPYLPPGARPWGRTRVGLRCVDGPSRWNVYLPVTVHLWAQAPVLREPRSAGYQLQDADFTIGEVDWAARTDAPLLDPEAYVGRDLARPLSAGQPVRADDLQRRQWFAAGDTVQVIARGRGYSVSSEGQALSRGFEGQTVRVRTTSGRVVTGTAVAEHRVELAL